jgi:hypothetical protein
MELPKMPPGAPGLPEMNSSLPPPPPKDITNDIAKIVISNVKKDYFSNQNDNPTKIEAQVKSDLLMVYYEDNDLSKRKVDSDIKDEIFKLWYKSIHTRNIKIINDFFNKSHSTNIAENNKDTPDSVQPSENTDKTPDLQKFDPETAAVPGSNVPDASAPDANVNATVSPENASAPDANAKVSPEDASAPDANANATVSPEAGLTPDANANATVSPEAGSMPDANANAKVSSEDGSMPAGPDAIPAVSGMPDAGPGAIPAVSGMPGAIPAVPGMPAGLGAMPPIPGAKVSPPGTGKNNSHVEKIGLFKYQQFAEEYFKSLSINHAASTNTVKNAHIKLTRTVLCAYLANSLKELSENLKLILFNGNKNIYDIFKSKVDILTTESNKKSTPIVRQPKTQKGGNGEVDSHFPTTYNWEKIQSKVNTEIGNMIREKMKPMTNPIQSAFKAVFLQSNCDALDLNSSDTKTMDTHLQLEYESILEMLCTRISNEKAQLIFLNYILRNYNELVNYLKDSIFANVNKKINMVEVFVNHFDGLADKMFFDKNITPICPTIKRKPILPDEKTDKMDECCNERKSEQGLSSGGVSEWVKTKNIRNETSIINYILSTPSTLLPVFNIFEKQFKECVKDSKFISTLFSMYSGKSIKFMKQVQMQFDMEEIEEYIERYILTKNPYVKNIIGRCIKHTADVKYAIFKQKDTDNEDDKTKKEKAAKEDKINTIMSKYSVCLMYLCCIEEYAKPDEPIIDYVVTTLPPFLEKVEDVDTVIDISDNIIKKIPSQHKKTYINDLANLLPTGIEKKPSTDDATDPTTTSGDSSSSIPNSNAVNDAIAAAIAATSEGRSPKSNPLL